MLRPGGDLHSVAWAAGLYDAEGSCSAYLPRFRKTHRRQMAVSQAGDPGKPPIVSSAVDGGPAVRRARDTRSAGPFSGRDRMRIDQWPASTKEPLGTAAGLSLGTRRTPCGRERRRKTVAVAGSRQKIADRVGSLIGSRCDGEGGTYEPCRQGGLAPSRAGAPRDPRAPSDRNTSSSGEAARPRPPLDGAFPD